jgi:hypothetical protein
MINIIIDIFIKGARTLGALVLFMIMFIIGIFLFFLPSFIMVYFDYNIYSLIFGAICYIFLFGFIEKYGNIDWFRFY